MRIDWPEYRRNHANRNNLLIHLLAVPLLVGALVHLLVCEFFGQLQLAAVLNGWAWNSR